MRDIATKADGSDSLTAPEFNSSQDEIENAVQAAGITLDGAAGPDNDLTMLAQAIHRHAIAGMSYQDGGSANSYVLTATQAGFQQPAAYFDGMVVVFKAGATNTGASQINVESIGFVDFKKAGGADHGAGEIGAGNLIAARYFAGDNRFEEVANTTPDIAGPAKADQFAIYTDTGSASTFTLAIVSPYIQPAAFTDQMAVLFKANATNDGVGAHPCAVSGLGSKNVVEADGTNPIAERIKADDWVFLVFSELRDALEIAFVYRNTPKDTLFQCVTSSSSGTVYNLSTLPGTEAPTEYIDGMMVIFRAPQINTGAVSINVNSLGNVSLRDSISGANFSNGEIPSKAFVVAEYIQSENRFRSFVARLTEKKRVFQEDFSTRSSAVETSLVIRNVAADIEWSSPDFDALGFYNAGNDNFEVPSGEDIERVDINVNLRIPTSDGDDYSLALFVGGNEVATGMVSGAGPGEGISLCALDVPVSDGDVIKTTIDMDAAVNRTITFANITIRPSKFSS